MTDAASKPRGRRGRLWRSLEHRAMREGEEAQRWGEFATEGPAPTRPPAEPGEAPADRLVPATRISRRGFFGAAGVAAAAAAGGCVRKDVEHILPYAKRPEEVVPGKPLYYATAFQLGGSVEGVVVESQDGRPTKIEGNPKHSGSQGGTSVWAQASVLDLYDPERTRVPLEGGTETGWTRAMTALAEALERVQGKGGQGLGLVLRHVLSPTQRQYLRDLKKRYPEARLFQVDPAAPRNAIAAAELIGGKGARARHHLRRANVVVSIDADFLHTEQDSTRLAREWAHGRRVVGPTDFMSRLYVVEPHLTNTGVMADHRLRVKASTASDVLIALSKQLLEGNYKSDNWAVQHPGQGAMELPAVRLDAKAQAFVEAVADDLGAAENLRSSAIVVGERQPMWAHALAAVMNAALGNKGGSHRWLHDSQAVEMESAEDLGRALGRGEVRTVVCLETNPAYDAPPGTAVAAGLAKATVIHAGLYRDETAQLAALHLPVSHYLEAWGDLESSDGTTTIQQPLISPLHGTKSTTQLLAFMARGVDLDGYSLLKGHWREALGGKLADRTWRTWLHDGVVTGVPREAGVPGITTAWDEVATTVASGRQAVPAFEVNFHLDPKIVDGRYANNAWLQELPHPVTKLTWDNAAYISPSTARERGLDSGDRVTLTVGPGQITLPVFVAPGQAEDTVSIALGYGRSATEYGRAEVDLGAGRGRPPSGETKTRQFRVLTVADGAGFNAAQVRPPSGWFAAGDMQSAGGTYDLVSTQDHGTMKPRGAIGFEFDERPIVLDRTRDEFRADPNFVEKVNLLEASRLKHLWQPPKLGGAQQWGLSVDLNACTGCNACVIACQAENNIPTVGKDRVADGREMHWMRIDRYFRDSGDPDDPTAVVQPMLCQHCEAAPCESVCPVAATTHSPEGLNDMVYNRCIGTRFCSNNCPYKVRRFNYFSYNEDTRTGALWTKHPQSAYLRQMQKNPDVTVRFRGVMEKCTYCVQRINQAKIEAHVAGEDLVDDGAIVTACQQVCPSEALVFGDIRDPDSKVSKAKRSPRDYKVLRDLNTQPRTTYLARIRNPNPKLGGAT